jgi:nucleoside triphosphate diphosphatase
MSTKHDSPSHGNSSKSVSSSTLAPNDEAPSRDINRLLAIMARLRDPETGCAWDVEQTFASIAPYTIEEAHEVQDAILRNDMVDLCDELGDLLLQVVFHARMAEEAGHFAFGDVVEAVTRKMIRRHPHVFGPQAAPGAKLAKGQWEAIKAIEKAEKRAAKLVSAAVEATIPGLLDDVPGALPAMPEALKLQARAARVGFDWSEAPPILDKIAEETAELREAMRNGGVEAVKEEWGDLAFALVNLARHLEIDPDTALKGASAKFRRRFAGIEATLARDGRSPQEASLDEMEAIWQAVKRAEKAAG